MMHQRKRSKFLACCLLITLVGLLIASTVLAAELLQIQPIKHDCGLVNEGDPATMLAAVKNISNQEVHVNNVKTN